MADIQIDIGTNDFEVVNSLSRVIRLLDEVENRAGRANNSLNFNSSSVRTYNRNVSGVVSNVSSLVGGFSKLSVLAGAAFSAVAIGKAASAVGNFAAQGVKAAAEYESTTIAFETFLGSAEAAQNTLKSLEEFSLSTPFTPDEVIGTGRLLLAFGEDAETLTNTLGRLGDIASGTKQPLNEISLIYGQVLAKGKLQGEELLQLTERGVPLLSTLAETLGKTEAETQELVSKGEIGFDKFKGAIDRLTDSGGKFFDLTRKQSQSIEGRISTLQGAFGQLQKEVGQALLPTFGILIEKALQFLDSIDTEIIEDFGELLESDILPALEGLIGSFGDLFGALQSNNEGFEESLPTLEDYIGVLVGVIDTLTNVVVFIREVYEENEVLQAGLSAFASIVSNQIKGALIVANAAFNSFKQQLELIRITINTLLEPLNLLFRGIKRLQGENVAPDVKETTKALNEVKEEYEKVEEKAKDTQRKSPSPVDPKKVKAAQNELDKIRKEYDKIFDSIKKQTLDAELSGLTDSERIKREAQLSIQAVNQLEEEFEAAAKRRAQKEKGFVSPDLSSDFENVRIAIRREENEQLLELEKERVKKVLDQANKARAERLKALELDSKISEQELQNKVFETNGILNTEEEKQSKLLELRRDNLQKRLAAIATEAGKEFDLERAEIANNISQLSDDISAINRDAFIRNLEQQESLRLQRIELLEDDKNNILTLEQEKEQARLEIQLEFAKKRLALSDSENGINSFESETLRNDIAVFESSLEKLRQVAEQKINPITGLFDDLKTKIQDALNIDDEQFGQLVGGLQQLGQQVFEAFAQINQAQIDANQSYIDAINERIEAEEGRLETELTLQEQGRANNVEGVKQEVADLEKERAAALAKQQQFLKRQQRLQEIQAAVNLISAAAQIYSSLAALPLGIGIPIAAGIVASMIAAFASTKSQAKSLSQFREGGEVKGLLHSSGGTIIEAQRGEFVTKVIPSQSNLPFLEEFNKGTYNNIDLKTLLSDFPAIGNAASDITLHRGVSGSEMKSIIKDTIGANMKTNERILGEIRDKPLLVGSPDYYMEITAHKKRVVRKKPS